jgi:transposase-like protein
MSKIPQGEWNAIAARYESGESISKIARSYGCTPPAIHYILKRNGQRPSAIPSPTMPTYPTETPQTRLVRANAAGTVSAVSAVRERVIDEAGSSGLLRARSPAPGFTTQDIAKPSPEAVKVTANYPESVSGPRFPSWPSRDATPSGPMTQSVAPQSVASMPQSIRDPGRVPDPRIPAQSVTHSGLDSELYSRAEAAIASFRSSFDAALAEGSADMRARLRQAATDLMRVAARTTMVLDRINATGEGSTKNHNYPRSSRLRDEFENNGFKQP